MLQTDYPFTLPYGYIDEEGNLHKEGIMRLATTIDEISPLADERVKVNEAFFVVLLLSRVVIQLGSLPAVTPAIIEHMFSRDFIFLQHLYLQINQVENNSVIETSCPNCKTRILLDLSEAIE